MKFLITGGAGFIGSAVVRYLVEQTEHLVINIDKLTYAGNLESLDSVSDSNRYQFIKADICDASSIEKVFTEYCPDIVMHLAAESHVDRSIDGPLEFLNTNIIGTFVMLEASRKYYDSLPQEKRIIFKFHHISTDEVYGDLPTEKDAENRVLPLFTEDTAYEPSSPYSASKAASDHLVRAWKRTYGLPTLVTNCSNNYGPYHFPEKLIPLTILNALDFKALPVYGDGSQIRDWLFVEDHAKALVLVAMKGCQGDTFNIGGNNEKTNLEVVTTICSILDKLVPLEGNYKNVNNISSFKELITFVEDRPGHDKRYAIDASKMNKTFDWKPEETFDSGILKTVKWYLSNEIWWKNVLSRDYSIKRKGVNS